MSEAQLSAICELIQQDVGKRGLRADPADNLITRTAGDFQAACHSIAGTAQASVAILTGFYIATANPPAGETDGPLGALFLARALQPLGIRVAIITEAFCSVALDHALQACGLDEHVSVMVLPPGQEANGTLMDEWEAFRQWQHPTHLVALERVGPSHADGRYYSMRARDITDFMSPAHRIVEDAAQRRDMTTIGIGDGGNEIGMGKIPWDVIGRNIPRGDRVACRVATDHLIVSGVSNWGAYGLAAGVRLLRKAAADAVLFDVERERELLQLMVDRGPLVDGVTGQPTATVDGLAFEEYANVLSRIGAIVGEI